MHHKVFLSYARSDHAAEAQALADALGHEAFLDTRSIPEGSHFPNELLEAVLAARVVVLFASEHYLDRPFCKAEKSLALHAAPDASHLVLALGEKPMSVLDTLPEATANINWPRANATASLVTLVRDRLATHLKSIGDLIPRDEASDLAQLFLAQASIPAPRSLQGIPTSFPSGFAPQSIFDRFLGRADDMRKLHQHLAESAGGAACISAQLAAGAGFGKTRMAIEYLYRYGSHYPGGIFWINAAASSLEDEFWRVLKTIDPTTPELVALRAQQVNIPDRLARALRSVTQSALYIADNIPETAPGATPAPLSTYCPAGDAVNLLVTSRQRISSASVKNLPILKLERAFSILLLKRDVPNAASLNREEWSRIADWVGDLPVVLDLLNRLLAWSAITPRKLLARCDAPASESTTKVLKEMSQALRDHVAEEDLYGIADALLLSYENLKPEAQNLARILAQLSPAPIPVELLNGLPDEVATPAARLALQARHFVTSAESEAFGVMHRLTADFLRHLPEEPQHASFQSACGMVEAVMTNDKCDDPAQWRRMERCKPHGETLFERELNSDAPTARACSVCERVARLLYRTGAYALAITITQRVVERRTCMLGEEHPDTVVSINNLGLMLGAQGDFAGSRVLHQRAAEICSRVFGPEHPRTLTSMDNLALCLRDLGERSAARELEETVLKQRTRILGDKHPDTLISLSNLALILLDEGDLSTARDFQERALEASIEILGAEHPNTLTSLNNLAATILKQGDLSTARKLHERELEISKRIFGAQHPDTLASMANLAFTLYKLGDAPSALVLYRDCLARSLNTLGDAHPITRNAAGGVQYIENQLQPEQRNDPPSPPA